MSGRRLGRLYGSLLFLVALAGVAFADPALGDLHLSDFVWY